MAVSKVAMSADLKAGLWESLMVEKMAVTRERRLVVSKADKMDVPRVVQWVETKVV